MESTEVKERLPGRTGEQLRRARRGGRIASARLGNVARMTSIVNERAESPTANPGTDKSWPKASRGLSLRELDEPAFPGGYISSSFQLSTRS